MSYFQVLGDGVVDGCVSIFLFFDEKRYLFSCSEGTQRFCTSHHIRLNKLEAIFLPRLEWSRTGGLPGLVCTIADGGGMERMRVVGPVNSNHFVGCLRAFLRRSTFEVDIREVGELSQSDNGFSLAFADEFIKVWAIEIFDQSHQSSDNLIELKGIISHEDTRDESLPKRRRPSSPFNINSEFVNEMFKTVGLKTSEDGGQEQCSEQEMCHERDLIKMNPVQQRHSSLCYLVEGPPKVGKFDAKLAKSLGVPVGPLNGKLMKGEEVILADGRIIKSEECVAPSLPGSYTLIVDIYCQSQFKSLSLQLAKLKDLYSVECIIHLTDNSIYSMDEYRQIFSVFGDSLQVWANSSSKASENSLSPHPDHMQLLSTLSSNSPPLTSIIPSISKSDCQNMPFLRKVKWNRRNEAASVTFMDQTDTISNQMHFHQNDYSPTPSDPRITFLGTAAALPGKYRNVSATLVDFGDQAILLDCGEATYGQIFRLFGPTMATSILSRLTIIFISHLHADHQLGVPGLLSRINSVVVGERVINLIAPERYFLFLEELGECMRFGDEQGSNKLTVEFISSERLHADQIYRESLSASLAFKSITPVPVIHCPHSFGLVLNNGSVQLAYSGDTRPCPLLAQMAFGSNILIHECTFCDELQAEAIAKRHSTISEALQVGQSMQAEFILLTHISQRYAKSVPVHHYPANSLMALDFMSVSLSQLRTLDLCVIMSDLQTFMPPDPKNVDT